MRSTRRGRAVTTYLISVLTLTVLAWACADAGILDGGAAGPEPPAQAAAGGNGNGGGGAPEKDPTVTEVEPDTVPQDTTVDLTVKGRDFDDGSVAEFGIDGVVTEKVKTNSTTFVDSRTLVANVTVAIDATVGDYDALVTTKRGRKGVGTEKLHIVENNGNPGGGGGDGVEPPPATVTVATPAGATLNRIECTGQRVGTNFDVLCDSKYQTVTPACFANGAQIEIGLIEVEARKGVNDRVIIHGMDGGGVEYWSGRVDIVPVRWDGNGSSGVSFTIPANVEAVMTKQQGKGNGVACPVSLGSMTYVFE